MKDRENKKKMVVVLKNLIIKTKFKKYIFGKQCIYIFYVQHVYKQQILQIKKCVLTPSFINV